MAYIEIRGNQHRVYWRTDPGAASPKTYEPFASAMDAEQFLALGAVLAGDYDEARRLVRSGELARLVERHPSRPVGEPALTAPDPGVGYGLAAVLEARLRSRTASRGRTKDDYRRDFKNHIAPYFGADCDVRTITSGRYYLPGQQPDADGATAGTSISGWLTWLETRPKFTSKGKPGKELLSAKTVRSLHGLLSGVLEFACMTEPEPLLARNPCIGSDLPDADPPVMHFLTVKAAFALLHHLDGIWYVVVLFALCTGARFGEIAGLEVRDFDLDGDVPTVSIRRAWARVSLPVDADAAADGGRTPRSTRALGRPKTPESVRTISLPACLVPHLRPLIVGRALDAAVFTMSRGGRLHHGNFLARVFRPAVLAAAADTSSVPADLRIHDLRHSHASWLIPVRPLSSIRARLGHRSILTTERYVHILAGQDALDAEAVESLIGADRAPITAAERDRLTDLALPVLDIDDEDDLAA